MVLRLLLLAGCGFVLSSCVEREVVRPGYETVVVEQRPHLRHPHYPHYRNEVVVTRPRTEAVFLYP